MSFTQSFLLFAEQPQVAEEISSASQAGSYQLILGLTVLGIIVLFGANWFSKTGIIARATRKESIRQPMFFSLLGVSILIMLLNTWIPFFAFGEDTKMFLDCGLATILISSILLAIWTSSMSIADEIEGKTAMTLLSKPINRRQFIVGKYLGLLQGIVVFMIPMAIAFCFLIYYKVGYDMKESGSTPPDLYLWLDGTLFGAQIEYLWAEPTRLAVVFQILPGLLLIFLEVAVLASISVVISTRLPMVVNFSIMFAVFIIGHLTPVLVQASVQRQELEFVSFVARLFATVFPQLDAFNMSAYIVTGEIVPPDYIGYTAIYGFVYCCAALLLAFILFEDRDLA